MDGRVQLPVIRYLQDRFGADYVDIVSEPGPNRILAGETDATALESIKRRVKISVEHHQSVGIAVVGHHDCAGNPSSEVEQGQHTVAAVRRIKNTFGHISVIGLWVDENWDVMEVQDDSANQVIEDIGAQAGPKPQHTRSASG
jgi:hypothetical protein